MINEYLIPLSTIFQSYRECQFYLEAPGVKIVSRTSHHGWEFNSDPGSYKFTIRTKRKQTENANETNEKRTNASHE